MDGALTQLFYASPHAIGIFPRTALLEHSCRPNAAVSITTDFVLVLTALEGIEQGDAVSFNYAVGLPQGATAAERRRHILAELGFTCCCDACCEEPG